MNAALADRWTVTEPGVVHGMPEDAYHADPVVGGSLSHSGAKTLMPPGCPALFAWQREHGRPDKKAFDVGSAVHGKVLGTGWPVEVIDAPDRRAAKTKEREKELRAAGIIPLLRKEMDEVEAMAAAVLAHPLAAALFGDGDPEVSLFWRDGRSGVMLRARLDWLSTPRDGRLIIPDLKTADSADPWTWARAGARFDYHGGAAWYSDGIKTLGIADDPQFLFVIVEKAPPYLVSVVGLNSATLRAGRARNRRAIDTYAQCVADDNWPGYSTDVEYLDFPSWALQED